MLFQVLKKAITIQVNKAAEYLNLNQNMMSQIKVKLSFKKHFYNQIIFLNFHKNIFMEINLSLWILKMIWLKIYKIHNQIMKCPIWIIMILISGNIITIIKMYKLAIMENNMCNHLKILRISWKIFQEILKIILIKTSKWKKPNKVKMIHNAQ